MSNSEKYNNCFIESLSVDKKILNDDLEYNSIPISLQIGVIPPIILGIDPVE